MVVASAPRPLIIVDNSLIDERGHHLALAVTLSRAALAAGVPVVIYAHEKLNPDLLPAGVDVRPVFTLSVYELFAGKMINHDMGIEMGQVLDRISAEHPEGGRILFHTADAYIYCAVAGWVAAQNTVSGAPWDMHIVTPYEPKLMPGFALKGLELHRSLLALGKARSGRVSVFFWTETARLAEFYRRAYGMITSVLELPTPQWAVDTAQRQPLRDGKLVMLFLGAAREEKGFLHLPDLAAEIARRPGLGDKVVMRLHCSAPIVGFSPPVEAAVTALRAYPFVETIDGAMELKRYAAEMRASDMALLLYHPGNYFARGSGIVMEALCSGKHILGTRGSFMERLDHGGLAHFASTAPEWADHVERVTGDLESTRAHGADMGDRIAARHAPEKYLAKLLNRERFAVHFNSMRHLRQGADMPLLVTPGSARGHIMV
jgi:hypothetical protein